MHCFLLFAGIALLGTVIVDAAEPEVSSKGTAELQALNREYIRSVLESDVGWFDRNLGGDFVCTNRDGSRRPSCFLETNGFADRALEF